MPDNTTFATGNKPPAKLLIVALATDYGGTEAYVLSLASLLQESTTTRAIVANDMLARKLKDANIPTTKLQQADGIGKLKQLYRAARTLIATSRAREMDALLVNGYSEIILVPLARALGHRAYATRHLSFKIEASKWPVMLRRRMARELYRVIAPSACGIIAVSEAVASDLREHCSLPAKRVTVISNWVNEQSIHQRDWQGNGSGIVRLLYVGRLVSFKGLGTLLSALRKVVEGKFANLPVHLDVVGVGPDEATFREMADQLPVTFHGMSDAVDSFYRRADIFVNPSLGPEGMPLVTLEAMASGLPCLLSDLPVHIEVAGGGASVLFEHGSVSSLVEHLVELVNDPESRKNVSARSSERILERFTPASARVAYRKALGL